MNSMRPPFFTVPNQLTFLRLALLPGYFILVFYGHYRWALAILAAAALTDALDGLLARWLHQYSELGAFLDPIADKLLLSSSFVLLSLRGKIGWWLTILVLARDVIIMITAAVVLLVVGYRTFPPTIYGKAATIVQVALVVVALAGGAFGYDWLLRAKLGLILVVAVLTVISGLHYSVLIARRISS